ncbi:TetR/AcrR family transcriptional regulator [Ligilactobacillus sp. WILCCON 0076]|uniref:TetR/AcrR family transcriptional regulator n=1 Tax=Ligilactobacillus ubinensis TaxID=2876789 RepID=A0A9X2FNA4_9LACO|nr:TetR/AcrR family transcriptional regulator [Ligilactobacillus ubinensis]MCP0887148.1 TetR/AcrR family transcriptional regulator [Ligilactobacillus ubinensis]
MTKTRRRGAELDTAIYQATRDILNQNGLDQLTFANVAERAGTSKPVIYRRWSSPLELAIEAIQDQIITENHGKLDEIVLTGTSLSEDLFQVFKRFTTSINTFNQAQVITWVQHFNQQNTPEIAKMINDAKQIDTNIIKQVCQRAQKRGELRSGTLSHELQIMPFDWLRYRAFANEPITDTILQLLVDELLVPAYQRALG